jgi:hypothetical protein
MNYLPLLQVVPVWFEEGTVQPFVEVGTWSETEIGSDLSLASFP